MLAGALAACSPALDWRDVRVPGGALVAQMPCRPGRFERALTLAGRPLRLYMLSCEAGGVTYGVATADVGDLAQVGPVLEALARAAEAGLRARDPRPAPYDLPGATPFPGNVAERLRGRRPDGVAVEESLRVFARGTRIFQASALGPTLPDEAIAPFEAGLRFDLESKPADPG